MGLIIAATVGRLSLLTAQELLAVPAASRSDLRITLPPSNAPRLRVDNHIVVNGKWCHFAQAGRVCNRFHRCRVERAGVQQRRRDGLDRVPELRDEGGRPYAISAANSPDGISAPVVLGVSAPMAGLRWSVCSMLRTCGLAGQRPANCWLAA